MNFEGMWNVDDSNGNSGCGTYPGWSPSSYDYTSTNLKMSLSTPHSIEVTIRSANDPLVLFYGAVGPAAATFLFSRLVKIIMASCGLVVGLLMMTVIVRRQCRRKEQGEGGGGAPPGTKDTLVAVGGTAVRPVPFVFTMSPSFTRKPTGDIQISLTAPLVA